MAPSSLGPHPTTFRGWATKGLKFLAEAREQTGLPIVTEVMSWEEVPLVARYADMLQIGARNMQNFALLRAAGRSGRPILLKRSGGATIEEWLHAAEYVLSHGNDQVVLCERGIRTFERATRHTLDLNAVALVRERTHLPVIADPSHAAGVRSIVPSLALAALAAGAHGVIVEVHPDPDHALSDGAQSLDLTTFARLAKRIRNGEAVSGRVCDYWPSDFADDRHSLLVSHDVQLEALARLVAPENSQEVRGTGRLSTVHREHDVPTLQPQFRIRRAH